MSGRSEPRLDHRTSRLPGCRISSEIITDLIRVMGCGVELGGSHNKDLASFNLDNLRFNKVVICTDADVDYQIRALVFDDALPSDADPHQQGLCLYRRVVIFAVRDQL